MFDSSGDNGPPCGVPSGRALATPPSLSPASRWRRIPLQHSFVLHLPRHSCHPHVVVPSVEELFPIQVHDPALPFCHVASGAFHRLLRVASGTKAVTRFGKLGFVPRLQYLRLRLLNKSIHL